MNKAIYDKSGPLSSQFDINIGDNVLLEKAIGANKFVSVLKTNVGNTGAKTFNIGLGVSSLVLPNTVGPRRASILGKCSFGSGGGRFDFDFDWHQGSQFSIQATSLDLHAAFEEISDDTADRVIVSASLVEGSRAARSQLTRTFSNNIVDTGAGTVIPVPNFAHAFYLFSPDPGFFTMGSVDVLFKGGPLATDQTQHTTGTDDIQNAMNFEDGTRFPEQTRFLRFTTSSEGAPFIFWVVFTLSV